MFEYSEVYLQYHPSMSADDAAKVWMRRNECTDNGLAATHYSDDGKMSVNYQEMPHGISIILHNGTCIPVPYKYQGENVCILVTN